MRKVVLFFYMFLAVGVFASSEYTILSESSFPNPSFVGDQVEFSINIRLRDAAKLEAPTNLDLLNSPWITIKEIKVLSEDSNFRRYTIRISFVSFFSGSFSLPEINLGGVVLKNIRLKTETSLEPGINTLSNIKGPMFLPGTRFIVIFLILFFLIIPVLVIIFSSRIKRIFHNVKLFFKNTNPYKKYFKNLTRLTSSSLSISAKEFYTLLLDMLRSFLGELYEKDFVSTTTREILEILESLNIPTSLKEFLKKIFVEADLIKFGGMKITPKEMHQVSTNLIAVSQDLIALKKKQRVLETKKKK